MRYGISFFLSFSLLVVPANAETLHYIINWPSGLSLGEATLSLGSEKSGSGPTASEKWSSDFEIDASLPGFKITDHYNSSAEGKEMCSIKLDKTVRRGSRKSEETDTFHQDTRTVTRETHGEGGGKSDIDVSACARDALTFLEFARTELAQGRLAPPESVVLGSLYQVRLDGMGAQTVKLGGKQVEADKVQATVKGAVSSFTVEIFFSRDPARTPVLINIPLALGKFSAELVH